LFDIQGWITLLLGGLLALITLFSSYSHVHIPFLGTIALDQQIGVLLLLSLVPPDVTPFAGPGAMRVGGHAAAA